MGSSHSEELGSGDDLLGLAHVGPQHLYLGVASVMVILNKNLENIRGKKEKRV
jgi:hypothetical protein